MNMHYIVSSTLSIYITLIDVVLRTFTCKMLSYAIVDLHLHVFYNGFADIQIWALLTGNQCRVSDTQVTVKAHGPLVLFILFIIFFNCDIELSAGQSKKNISLKISFSVNYLVHYDLCYIKFGVYAKERGCYEDNNVFTCRPI